MGYQNKLYITGIINQARSRVPRCINIHVKYGVNISFLNALNIWKVMEYFCEAI